MSFIEDGVSSGILINPLTGRKTDDPAIGVLSLGIIPHPYTFKNFTEIGSPWAPHLLSETAWGKRTGQNLETIRERRSERLKVKKILEEPDAALNFDLQHFYFMIPPWTSCTINTSLGDCSTNLGIVVAALKPKPGQSKEFINLAIYNPWGPRGAFQYLADLSGKQVDVVIPGGSHQQYLPEQKTILE